MSLLQNRSSCESEVFQAIELKKKLEHLRSELSTAIKTLDEYDFFGCIEGVDKQLDDDLKAKTVNLTDSNLKLENEIQSLRISLPKLKTMDIELDLDLKELKKSLNVMQRSSTPRPNWKRCGLVIDGGPNNWLRVSRNKTSKEKAEILFDLIYGDSDKRPCKVDNCLVSRPLNRRELGLAIKELWSAKLKHNNGKINREKISDFIISYYEKKFFSNETALKFYKTLKDSCSIFPHYDNAELFLQVLNGEIDENIYFEFYAIAGLLFLALSEAVNENHMDKNSVISFVEFCKVLRRIYPDKSKEEIIELKNAAIEHIGELKCYDSSNNKIDFKLLFTEDDEGRLNTFLKTLKSQFIQKNKST